MATIAANHVKIGVFVTTSVFLATIGILILGRTSFNRSETLFESYMEGSVQGLDVGGAVKYRGIPIGKIREITLIQPTYSAPDTPDGQRAKRYARIVFAVDGEKFCRQECEVILKQVSEGLRVFQKPLGITGMKFLDLDFLDINTDQITLPVPWTPKHLYIPSARGFTKAITDVIEHLSNQLTNLDLQLAVTSLTEVIESIGDDIRQAEIGEAGKTLRSILEKTDTLAATFNDWIESEELAETAQSLSSAVASVERTAKEIETSLPALMQSGTQLIQNADNIATDSRISIAESLENLRRATDSIDQVLDQIKENPSVLIRSANHD